MRNNLIIAFFLSNLVGSIIAYYLTPEGVNSAIIDFLTISILVFSGPIFTVFLLGSLIPPLLSLSCIILAIIGLVIVTRSYKALKVNGIYLGSLLWSISGTALTVLGLIGGCC